jgi:hypothetical protein
MNNKKVAWAYAWASARALTSATILGKQCRQYFHLSLIKSKTLVFFLTFDSRFITITVTNTKKI